MFTNEENRMIDECFEFAKDLIKNAGKLVEEGYSKSNDDKKISEKGAKWDAVTEYDKKTEEYLIGAIKLKYPEHKIIAEESEELNRALGAEPTWIIDPIDGTNNFIRRIPFVAISVGFVWKYEICIGIIYNPILNDFYSARLATGAFLNGKQIHCTKVEKLEDACIGHEVSFLTVAKHRDRNTKQVISFASSTQGFRSFGSCAISLSFVAQGSLDGYQINELYAWDIAAGILLIREAGGYCYKPDGSPIDLNDPKLICGATERLCNEMIKKNKQALGL